MGGDSGNSATAGSDPGTPAGRGNIPTAGEGGADMGYDLYPERTGGKFQHTMWERLMWRRGNDTRDKTRCENNVIKCVEEGLGVRLMMDALKSAGCPIDISRHFSCETCSDLVTGGYDPLNKQIVICQNRVVSQSMVESILVHEMIHVFDYCKNKFDFKNMDHIACTEIRAANLTHCSFVSSMLMGDSHPLKIKATHQDCVKDKAACSLIAARDITKAEAMQIVERVFPRCYADLEPVGRRLRRNSTDLQRAYYERHRYGYV